MDRNMKTVIVVVTAMRMRIAAVPTMSMETREEQALVRVMWRCRSDRWLPLASGVRRRARGPGEMCTRVEPRRRAGRTP